MWIALRKIFFVCLGLAAGLSPVALLAEKEPESGDDALYEFLSFYDGTWRGTYWVTDLAGEPIQKIEVEQVYWWEEKDGMQILQGNAVYNIGDEIAYAQSQTYILFGALISKVRQGQQTIVHKGKISKDGNAVSWRPTGEQQHLDQEVTETFTVGEGGLYIKSSGHEAHETEEGQDARVLIKGKLQRISAAEAQKKSQPKP